MKRANDLILQIWHLHVEIGRGQDDRYREMFELLTTAKRAVGDGGWLKWLADHEERLGFGERQAQRYLREPALRKSDMQANRQAVAEHRSRAVQPMPVNPDEAERAPRAIRVEAVDPTRGAEDAAAARALACRAFEHELVQLEALTWPPEWRARLRAFRDRLDKLVGAE